METNHFYLGEDLGMGANKLYGAPGGLQVFFGGGDGHIFQNGPVNAERDLRDLFLGQRGGMAEVEAQSVRGDQ